MATDTRCDSGSRNRRASLSMLAVLASAAAVLISGCGPAHTPAYVTATRAAEAATSTAAPSPAASPSAAASPTAQLTATATPRPTATLTTRPTATPLPTTGPTAPPTATATLAPIAQIRALVVSSGDDRALYAIIGERAYRSADRGATWTFLDTTGVPPEARLFTLALDYRDPSVLYAATSSGIYRRVGANEWKFVHPLNAQALAVDFVDSNVLWAGVSWTTEYRAVLLKSTDAGRTWGKADFGIQAYSGYGVTSILIDPADPNILYANLRYGGRFGWPWGWLYRGGRGGTWEVLRLGPEETQDMGFSEDACIPHGLAFDPTLRRLYVGCDAYYYNKSSLFMLRSDNAHAPNSQDIAWSKVLTHGTVTRPFALGFVAPLAVDARLPKAVYAVVSGTSTVSDKPYRFLVSHDDGQTWTELAVPAF